MVGSRWVESCQEIGGQLHCCQPWKPCLGRNRGDQHGPGHWPFLPCSFLVSWNKAGNSQNTELHCAWQVTVKRRCSSSHPDSYLGGACLPLWFWNLFSTLTPTIWPMACLGASRKEREFEEPKSFVPQNIFYSCIIFVFPIVNKKCLESGYKTA